MERQVSMINMQQEQDSVKDNNRVSEQKAAHADTQADSQNSTWNDAQNGIRNTTQDGARDDVRDGVKSSTGKEKKRTWVFRGLVLSLAAAILFTACYSYFDNEARAYMQISLDSENNVGWLYQNTYVLYRDLYNRENQTQATYLDLYLQLSDWEELAHDGEEALEQPESIEEFYWDDGMDYYQLSQEMWAMYDVFQEIENDFDILNRMYGYVIRDNQSDYYVTNMSEEKLNEIDSLNHYFILSFIFDNAGNVTVGESLCGSDGESLRRTANQVTKNTLQIGTMLERVWRGPVDCTVTYVISDSDWVSLNDSFERYYINSYEYSHGNGTYVHYYNASYFFYSLRGAYTQVGVVGALMLILLALFVLGCFLPVGSTKPWQRKGVCALPLEVLVGIGFLAFACIGLILELVVSVASGEAVKEVNELLHKNSSPASILIVWISNVLLLTVFFFVVWYLGVCARAIREMGLRSYLQERCLIYRIFPYTAGKFRSAYRFFTHVDLTKNSRKAIRRIVLINAVILVIIGVFRSVFWGVLRLGGLGVLVVYSFVLYFILKKYISDIQKRYGILLKAVDEMAEGNLNVTIDEDLGVFEPFKPQVIKIQSGFRKAVDEEIKSQRMKAELITNVSHDLKTPLTAIITYVNLLKDPDLTEEQRQEYLAIMERKSLRLKVLIEDLFEVSKANSRSMTLNLMPVDIMNLVKQVSFEMKDKLEEAQLDVRMNLSNEKISLSLDSQKTYRIYENLFANVAKYALRGTRVYVNGFRIDDTVVITIKNISEQELTVEVSELTERFVRGDASRNTEGSGLGLAIAKSFMEMQGGELELEADGDLFKATTIWHV